jgi:hypothetical protein
MVIGLGMLVGGGACDDTPNAAPGEDAQSDGDMFDAQDGAQDGSSDSGDGGDLARYRAANGWMRDAQGRALLLHGINVSGASKRPDSETGALVPSWLGDDDWERIAGWGFNAVRFLVFWEALEPAPDTPDEAYLTLVDTALQGADGQGSGGARHAPGYLESPIRRGRCARVGNAG